MRLALEIIGLWFGGSILAGLAFGAVVGHNTRKPTRAGR